MAASSEQQVTVNPKLPTWSGDWSTWADYRMSVEFEQDSTAEDDLPKLGPRLVRNLTGKAWEAIGGIDRTALKKADGVDYLLKFLEGKRGRLKVDVLGDALATYFQKNDMVRKDQENWNDFEARFDALLRDVNKAIKEVNTSAVIPPEIHGWFLLHQFIRLEPSDVASVKSIAKTYKLEDVVQAMRQMWGGDSLAQKDVERKKNKQAGRIMMNEPDTQTETAWMGVSQDPHDEETLEETLPENFDILFEEACMALEESPDDPAVLANFQEMRKLRYPEARKALDRNRTSRGFFPSNNRRSNGPDTRSSRPGQAERCIRCGKFGHKARDCRQKVDAKSNRSENSGKIGFVGYSTEGVVKSQQENDEVPSTENQLWLEEDLDNHFEICPVGVVTSCEQNDHDEEVTSFVGSVHAQAQHKAIIDCGASESIVGASMLQDYCDELEKLGFNSMDEVTIDRQVRKSFIFGNDQTSSALGLAQVNVGLCGQETTVDMHIVDGATPFLLSSRWLYEQGAVINFRTGRALFPKISNKQVQLERSPTFHLLLPLTGFEGNSEVLSNAFVNPQDQCVSIQELSKNESDAFPNCKNE